MYTRGAGFISILTKFSKPEHPLTCSSRQTATDYDLNHCKHKNENEINSSNLNNNTILIHAVLCKYEIHNANIYIKHSFKI